MASECIASIPHLAEKLDMTFAVRIPFTIEEFHKVMEGLTNDRREEAL